MSIDLKEKKRRKFLHLLTYFLTSDTIQFFDETKCNNHADKLREGQAMNKKENHSAKSEIEQAFLRLMTQKSYMDITVTDIVQEANVARVSFYRNFASISEVLDSIADATAEKLNIEFLPLLDTTDERKLREYLFNYFYQISLNYKEMWAIRGLNMDLFTKRLGEKIHEKRKAVESAAGSPSGVYSSVRRSCAVMLMSLL